MRRSLRLLIAVVAAGLPAAALAQRDTTAIVRGVATDSARQPIEDVEVYAPGIGRGVRTGSDGRFVLIHLLPGATRLLVRRLGWHMLDTTVALEPGRDIELRISLLRIAQQLEQVLIVAHDECPNRTLEGFECRRRSGIGIFRDTTEFAAAGRCACSARGAGASIATAIQRARRVREIRRARSVRRVRRLRRARICASRSRGQAVA